MKGDHDRQVLGAEVQARRQQVHGRMQAVGRRLVLDVHDIWLHFVNHPPYVAPQIPSRTLQPWIDSRLVSGGRCPQVIAARVDVRQNVHVGAQQTEGLAEVTGVVAHTALHDWIFAGDKKNTHKDLLR